MSSMLSLYVFCTSTLKAAYNCFSTTISRQLDELLRKHQEHKQLFKMNRDNSARNIHDIEAEQEKA